MAQENRPPRLAVLIDADNASPKIVGRLFEEIAKIGDASVRRMYGDFSSPRLKAWAESLAKHAMVPQQQFANVAGKNASDIALVIDAMDLLHSGRFEGFCLVSSDSDFTRLASRLREQGVAVYGFGEQKTPESFRQACHRFIYTENLANAENPRAAGDAVPQPKALRSAMDAVPLLMQAMAAAEAEDGWADLAKLGQRLQALASDFDQRTYGFQKLSDLVRNAGPFELGTSSGGRPAVRLKPTSPALKAKRTTAPSARGRR